MIGVDFETHQQDLSETFTLIWAEFSTSQALTFMEATINFNM